MKIEKGSKISREKQNKKIAPIKWI